MTNVHAQRREELMRRIGPRAVAAVLAGSKLARRNRDVDHRYRAPSDALYLTGFVEPESWIVLAPSRTERFTMFVRPRDPEQETWTGRRLGVEGAVEKLGADRAFPIDKLGEQLVELLDGADEVHFVAGDDPEVDAIVLRALSTLRAGERRGRRAPTRIVDLQVTLYEQRLRKDEAALDALRRAAAVTAEAHIGAMRLARPGLHEYEVEAFVDYTFRRHGGVTGYPSIVGGGVNATILHYTENQDALGDGDLLLIDAGCELDGFTADVTRTFPIGGRFSDAQRALYEFVLDAEKQCIALVRPGATIDGIHQRAVEILTEGLVRLGLLVGEVAKLIETNAYKRFYMHRTSHWLGLDVHDVGAYYLRAPGGDAFASRPLEPGMVLTVEPGLYVGDQVTDVPAGFRGVGIRIEDDVLVTETGHEVLTRAIPKEVADVEALCREGR